MAYSAKTIDLAKLATDPAAEVPSMVQELEGISGNDTRSNIRWPGRFTSSGKFAPPRWPLRFVSSQKGAPSRDNGRHDAAPRWTTRFVAAGPKSAPTRG
jgi:hypothetical protein